MAKTETQMSIPMPDELYQINYKYVLPNGKIRSTSMAVTAQNTTEAHQKASRELTAEGITFSLGKITLFR